MRVLVPMATGFEEIECVCVLDVLRRAEIEAVAVSMTGDIQVAGAHGLKLAAHAIWDAVDPDTFDMIAIPGGMGGTRMLQRDERLLRALRAFAAGGKPLAAVCAAPLVLQSAGILEGRTVTCHPGVAGELTVTERLNDRVVIDGQIITSQGPGTSIEFALAIVRHLTDADTASRVAQGMVCDSRIVAMQK